MKQILVLSLILVLSNQINVKGSEFPDSSFIWTVRNINTWRGDNCYNVLTYKVSGDSLINNHIYKQIFSCQMRDVFSESNSDYFGSVRDSSGFWYIYSPSDGKDHLLYNFNVSIGDTIEIDNPSVAGSPSKLIVRSKDSLLVGKEYKTRFGIGHTYGWISEYWIEDIGSTRGPFFVSAPSDGLDRAELSCVYSQGEFIHNFSQSSICGCGLNSSINHKGNNALELVSCQ